MVLSGVKVTRRCLKLVSHHSWAVTENQHCRVARKCDVKWPTTTGFHPWSRKGIWLGVSSVEVSQLMKSEASIKTQPALSHTGWAAFNGIQKSSTYRIPSLKYERSLGVSLLEASRCMTTGAPKCAASCVPRRSASAASAPLRSPAQAWMWRSANSPLPFSLISRRCKWKKTFWK